MKMSGNTENEPSSTTNNSEQNAEESVNEEKPTEKDNNNELPAKENSNQISETAPVTNNRVNNTSTATKKAYNANLADFGFTPVDFKGFKPWQAEYSATVKGDVEQINIYAKL